MVPFLEVSHLASSTSFCSAVVQPLGLRYISAASPSTVTFGTATFPPIPVFELRQVAPTATRPLKPSRLVLSAGSAAAVDDFHAFAHRASANTSSAVGAPCLPPPGRSSGPSDTASVSSADEAGERRAKVTDFDGNIMEVVYVPPPDYPSRFGGSTVRRTQSTHDEVTRILDWNYDVASSVPPSAAATSVRGSNLALARRPGRYPDDEPYALLRRSVTTTSVLEPTPAPSPRQNSTGLSTGAVVGTLLGVAAAGAAAGAALTYGMIKNDRARAPLQQFEEAPAFQRRSTFPEPYPDRRGRFMEVERTVEKVRYPEDYPPVAADHRPAPSYIARYSQAPAIRSKEVDDIYDDHRSRHSSRYRAPQAATVRTRSEAPLSRTPLMIADADHRSYTSSKRSVAPAPSIRRSSTFDVPDRESYVSARSQRTASTIRPPPVLMPVPAPSHSQLVTRSKPSSRVTATTVKVLGNAPSQSPASRGLSRAGSYMSARNVPLPPSGVGSSHAHWDDDADSVVPSDSISCVGSRRSSRPYH